MVHPVKLGRNTRMSYGKIREVIDMPNLIEIQKNSYDWFLKEGLKEVRSIDVAKKMNMDADIPMTSCKTLYI